MGRMVQLRAFVRMGALFFRACCKLGKGTKKGPFHAERELRTAEPNMARKRAEEGEGGDRPAPITNDYAPPRDEKTGPTATRVRAPGLRGQVR